MIDNMRFVLGMVLVVGLLYGCSDASDSGIVESASLSEAEIAALSAMEAHMIGRNEQDAAQIAAANNYPHLRLGGGQALIFDTYEIFKQIEEAITIPNIDDGLWHHSVWDDLQPIQSTDNKVHIAAKFSRIDADGNAYVSSNTFWIVTNHDGHWGIQMRSSFVEEAGNDDTGLAEAEEAALGLVNNYIDRFNDRDFESLSKLHHYPQFMLDQIELKTFGNHEDYISYLENTAFKTLDYAEWDHSELGMVQIIQSSPKKVHLVFSCQHLNVVGDECGKREEFWVITNVDGHWAIKAKSLL
jgi:hypothetical protein